jgi:copper chaperone CopZ
MHCVRTIQNEIGEVQGVQAVEANLNTKNVTIQFDTPATPETLEATLAEINYPPQKN